MRILFDPGHGGSDPGAVSGSVTEADIALRIAQQAMHFATSRGHCAFMTRFSNYDLGDTKSLDLAERVNIAKVVNADIFVSIHCNASENPQAHGFEIWTSPGETESDKAATEIYDQLEAAYENLTFRYDYTDGDKDKEASFYVLQYTKCPAVLCEFGFITNRNDRAKLLQRPFRIDLAKQLVFALEAWDAERQARCSL